MSYLNKIPKRDLSWLLGLWLGGMMMYHSYETLFFGGLNDFAGYLENMGIPLPNIFAPLAKSAEFFGGLAIIIGSAMVQRVAALFIIIVMMVATFIAHKGLIWSDAQLSFSFLLMAIFLFFKPAPILFNVFKKNNND